MKLEGTVSGFTLVLYPETKTKHAQATVRLVPLQRIRDTGRSLTCFSFLNLLHDSSMKRACTDLSQPLVTIFLELKFIMKKLCSTLERQTDRQEEGRTTSNSSSSRF